MRKVLSGTNRSLLTCLMLVAVAAVFALVVTPPNRSLWKRARMVQPREDLVYPAAPGRSTPALRLQGDWPYCWVGPDRLLVYYFDGSLANLDARLIDARTGRWSHAHSLDAWLRPAIFITASSVHTELACQTSPDGVWVAAPAGADPTSSRYGELYRPIAMRVDGSRTVVWHSLQGPGTAAWLPDGRRWADLFVARNPGSEANLRLRVYTMDPSPNYREYAYDLGSQGEWMTAPGAAPALAGTLADGRLLAIDWNRISNAGTVLAARFLPDAEAEHPLKQEVAVPCGASSRPLVMPVLSPSGNRLAWLLSTATTPPGWPATRPWWTFWKTRPREEIAVWTTKPDGSDPQEIGAYTRNESATPSLLQWTPDGKSLSFRYDGALYVIPSR